MGTREKQVLWRDLLFSAISWFVALQAAVFINPVSAQAPADLNGFVGRWQLNLADSKLLKYGPNGKNEVRAATYTFIFALQDQGLRLDVYSEYPRAAAVRSIDIVPDGRQHPCTGKCVVPGVQSGQTYAYSQIDSHMLVRVTNVDGKVTEYNTYAVSADGRIFTMITWNPDTPWWQNIYVFEKQR
jgi:hypothetical protein